LGSNCGRTLTAADQFFKRESGAGNDGSPPFQRGNRPANHPCLSANQFWKAGLRTAQMECLLLITVSDVYEQKHESD